MKIRLAELTSKVIVLLILSQDKSHNGRCWGLEFPLPCENSEMNFVWAGLLTEKQEARSWEPLTIHTVGNH